MSPGLELSDKEAVGVYLLLVERQGRLDEVMSRLARRIEDDLLKTRTVEEYENPEDLYRSLPDRPAQG